jgi:MinD-like ATPase involved in chromosome partitioning or flagellar assembly
MLSPFDNTENFFSGEGTSDFSDILYMIKSKKSNFALKLESAVREDRSGAAYIQSSFNALDMQELTDDELQNLVRNIQNIGSYDALIIDTAYEYTERMTWLMQNAARIVMVSTGESVANSKTERALTSIQLIDEQKDELTFDRIRIIYNRFSSKTGMTMERYKAMVLGGIPRFENATAIQISEKISAMNIFDDI